MIDNNRALDIFLCRIGGDEFWFAETDRGDVTVRGEGASRAAALIDLASVLSVATEQVASLEARVVDQLEALIRLQEHDSAEVAQAAAMALGRIVAMVAGI